MGICLSRACQGRIATMVVPPVFASHINFLHISWRFGHVQQVLNMGRLLQCLTAGVRMISGRGLVGYRDIIQTPPGYHPPYERSSGQTHLRCGQEPCRYISVIVSVVRRVQASNKQNFTKRRTHHIVHTRDDFYPQPRRQLGCCSGVYTGTTCMSILASAARNQIRKEAVISGKRDNQFISLIG